MAGTYVVEIALEMGQINRIIFNDLEAANTELNKLKEKMGSRFGKNSEEIVEINGPAEKYYVVVGRVLSAAVIDRLEHEAIQQETAKALNEFSNQQWIEATRKIVEAGLGEYIKK